MRTLDRELRQLINESRILGGGQLSFRLSDHELLRLCAVGAADLGRTDLVADFMAASDLPQNYYSVPTEWFLQPIAASVSFENEFLILSEQIEDFPTYFKQLCMLHKRRRKFELILEHQAFPQLEQIVPRCLLEYGLRPSATLSTWLVWRKWLYDVDNRSAQETGYLFEPILAAAIGGKPYPAQTSPVRRADTPTKGRQVDCIDDNLAYEFKMRVTIAASGQGRFREELDFARDCHRSEFIPVLLVLDRTPSPRLDELRAIYATYGGTAYVGDDAWSHVEAKAGNVMARFVEKYVRNPIREVDDAYGHLGSLSLEQVGDTITVRVGTSAFSIHRSRDQATAEELGETAAQEG